jgi:hypothetical protein
LELGDRGGQNFADGTPGVHIDMDVLDGEITLQERMRN